MLCMKCQDYLSGKSSNAYCDRCSAGTQLITSSNTTLLHSITPELKLYANKLFFELARLPEYDNRRDEANMEKLLAIINNLPLGGT